MPHPDKTTDYWIKERRRRNAQKRYGKKRRTREKREAAEAAQKKDA